MAYSKGSWRKAPGAAKPKQFILRAEDGWQERLKKIAGRIRYPVDMAGVVRLGVEVLEQELVLGKPFDWGTVRWKRWTEMDIKERGQWIVWCNRTRFDEEGRPRVVSPEDLELMEWVWEGAPPTASISEK